MLNILEMRPEHKMATAETRREQLESIHSLGIEVEKPPLKFDPPLYLQRYDHLCSLLERLECRSWMDIGCSDCRLITRVKNFNQQLNLIVGLDIDESLLEFSKERFTQQWFDFFQARQTPLDLFLIAGDVSQLDVYFLNQVRP